MSADAGRRKGRIRTHYPPAFKGREVWGSGRDSSMCKPLMTTAGLLILSSLVNPLLTDGRILDAVQDKKLDIPDEAAQKDAEKIIKGLFKEDYAKRAPADRVALAKNLLRQGTETRDNDAARYVLLREAQDLAARAGDIDTALQAVEGICSLYATNHLTLKNAALAVAAGVLSKPEELKPLAQAYLALAEEASQARQFELAVKAAQGALAAAKRAKDLALVTRAESQSKALAGIQERFERAKKWVDALATSPDNLEANQAVGEFECLLLGDWAAGLPKLAKGSDATLKALAVKDLSQPTDGAELSALGDGWWDRAEKESGVPRSNLRQRAGYWYEKASSKLSGLSKIKVDKRLEDLGPATSGRNAPESPSPRASSNTIDLLALIDLKRDAIKGNWTRNAQGIISPSNDVAYLQLPYVPGEEYDLTVVVKRGDGGNSLNIGVVVGAGANRHHGMVGFDCGPNGDLFGVGTSGGQGRLLGDVRHPYTIVCQVRKSGVAVQLDGKKVMDYQGDAGALSVGSQWVLPSRDAPFIGSWTTSFTILKIALTPVTGQGKKAAAGDSMDLPLSGAGASFDKKRKLETIDLLAKFDPGKDVLAGSWKLNGHILTGTGAGASQPKVEFRDYTPPEEYDLTVVMDRREGSNSITVVLPGGGMQFGAIFDWFNGEKSVMFSDVVPGKFLVNKTPKTIVFMVRKEGVVVRADGKDFFTCKVAWEKVGAISDDIALKAKNTIGFRIVAPDVFNLSALTVTAPK
jgi:hypothetical protein